MKKIEIEIIAIKIAQVKKLSVGFSFGEYIEIHTSMNTEGKHSEIKIEESKYVRIIPGTNKIKYSKINKGLTSDFIK